MIHIASYIDHTILKPLTTHADLHRVCEEAKQYGFAAVCIPPALVRDARTRLSVLHPAGKQGAVAPVELATVIGFPFGYSSVKAKLAETAQALEDGADELDVVINLIALRNQQWEFLDWEMQAIADLIHARKKVIKVIIESGVLTEEEIIRCCRIYGGMGVDFVKTSTGYSEKGASVEAVRLMRQHLPDNVRIKASGGIRDYGFARQLVDAGADRLGCSASIEIVQGESRAAAHPEASPVTGGKPAPLAKRKNRKEDPDEEIGGEG